MRKFLITEPVVDIGAVYRINASDSRHIKDVLRLKPGAPIRLFNEAGQQFEATIESVSAEGVEVIITEAFAGRNESRARVTVAQAFLKNKKMDSLVRQLTELGINAWVPVVTEHAVVKPDPRRLPARISRWQTIAREAVKQCERDVIPAIQPPVSLEEALADSQQHDLKIIFTARGGRPLSEIAADAPEYPSLIILLGPEGGFSPREIELAESHGFAPAIMGPRVLKADTATVAACALVQIIYGDMGDKGEKIF
ncbi:MAG: 16S rRNA (uracil(1498)-N(3))-methyltransferase [Desulfosudaceae bacterium]